MKFIDVPDVPSFTFVPFHKGDLVWVSQFQMPFMSGADIFQNQNGSWSIPCDLCRIVKIYYNENGSVWGMLVYDNITHTLTGIHLGDVVQNYTKYLKDINMIRSANIIKRHYHKHYTIRKLMANRIKRAYIQHYWHPNNPNMVKRLYGDFHTLISM